MRLPTRSALDEPRPRRAVREEARFQAAWAKRPEHDPRYTWSNAGHVLLIQERERAVVDVLARQGYLPLAEQTVLEVGCGTGDWLREFIRWGARPDHLTGIDLLPERIAEARRLCPPRVRLECASATALPFKRAAFDLVLQATVLSSVLDQEVRHAIAREMRRVVKPAGLILWYDFHMDNPRNRDVRGIRRREIQALFPDCRLELRRVTLAPPVARWLAPRVPLLVRLLGAIPLLRTHYLGALRPTA
jgi:SAM-dependent methyltransferase